jgi:hypothetical protein
MNTRRPLLVSGDVSGKDSQRTAHHADNTVWVTARPTPVDLIETAQESRQEPRSGSSLGKEREIFRYSGEAVHARSALPGALTSHEASDPRRLGYPAAGSIEHDDDANTSRNTNGA